MDYVDIAGYSTDRGSKIRIQQAKIANAKPYM